MTSTIITGVDASETAAAAARKAAELASALDATLHLICAYGRYESTTFESGPEKFHYSNEEEALKTAESVARSVRGDFAGLTIRAEAAEGKPGDALVKAAERLRADVIVVGNKRVQGMARMLGSIARDVASQAPCDVYVAYTHERKS
ncbi:universal stress protein [Citricoccus nitrophenolicus]|uniref:Universal stress protein n=1 Tax=Citricoccus nitrophenolicus TaxID=863575 RepID=A0ABV0IFM2_9MICC